MSIPDNYDLFERHEAEQHIKELKLPRCCECDNPITDEICFEFDGELFCKNCIIENHRKWVDDYVS